MFTPEVIFLTVLVFFVLVGFHEWGHFYFAKRAGILVREFAIGFGPKLFSYKKGETRYTLRLLPIGGFVRMAGEDPEMIPINLGQTIGIGVKDGIANELYLDQLDHRRGIITGEVEAIDLDRDLHVTLLMSSGVRETYAIDAQAMMIARGKETQIAPINRQFGGKSVGKRAMSIVAGPLMNFILAFGLFLAYVGVSGIPEHILLSYVEPNSAAVASGLEQGDLVIAVNGEELGTDKQKLVDLIAAEGGKQMQWTIQRGDVLMNVNVTPTMTNGTGKVGIHIDLSTRGASVTETISGAGTMMVDYTKAIFIGFKILITQFNIDDLGGPLRIVEVTGQAASLGIGTLLWWAAILSLYLGIFNLLPIPALDGSRLLFLGIEWLRGKPVDPARESMVHFIGFAMLMMLMIAVTYNDILRLFKG